MAGSINDFGRGNLRALPAAGFAGRYSRDRDRLAISLLIDHLVRTVVGKSFPVTINMPGLTSMVQL